MMMMFNNDDVDDGGGDNNNSSASASASSFQPYTPPPPPPPPPPQPHQANPRKKRTKLIRVLNHDNVVVKKPSYKKPDPSAPKITRPCSECGKKFWSWKALFGHMRCHPERQWRGINPPPSILLRRTTSSSSDYYEDSNLTLDDHEVASCLLMLSNAPPRIVEHAPATLDDGDVEAGGCVGGGGGASSSSTANVNSVSRFECSSCNKVFGSGQALGGHRASHKNVKGCFAITRNDLIGGGIEEEEEEHHREDTNNNNDNVHHQCSICSRVFSSGQALGGHKRCHWEKMDELQLPPMPNSDDHCGRLDLNLPVPPVAIGGADIDDDDDDEEEDDSSQCCYSSGGLQLDLRLGL